MPSPDDFVSYARFADQLIERATKEQLADVAKFLAINIGWYQQKGTYHRMFCCRSSAPSNWIRKSWSCSLIGWRTLAPLCSKLRDWQMISKMSRVTSLLLLLLLPLVSWSQELAGRVVRAIDGDTLVVLDPSNTQHKIRLAGIDCPERMQPWSTKAKQALSDNVFDRQVVVDWDKRDRYKRLVGNVLAGQRDVNLALVREGMCWWYRKYADAEEGARRERKGLWSDPESVPPWEWRRR